MYYIVLSLFLFFVMVTYFKIAIKFNVIDKPNERSSHTEVTIRGGGIIFVIVGIIAIILYPQYWLAGTGLFLIGTISFIDDRVTLSNKIRLLIHFIAVTLLFVFLNVFSMPLYWAIVLYIIAMGIINMYNFMDGINGITGAYTLVILGGLQYINLYKFNFIEADIIWLPVVGCIVFLYFNFRKKAKCFAGDVGSVSIAFWIVLLMYKLCLDSNNWVYTLFLSVYGVDSVLTILHRLILKQNIFKAHRLHLYQMLANEHRFSHLTIAIGYALLQMLVITFIVSNSRFSNVEVFMMVLLPLTLTYLIVKPRLMKINEM